MQHAGRYVQKYTLKLDNQLLIRAIKILQNLKKVVQTHLKLSFLIHHMHIGTRQFTQMCEVYSVGGTATNLRVSAPKNPSTPWLQPIAVIQKLSYCQSSRLPVLRNQPNSQFHENAPVFFAHMIASLKIFLLKIIFQSSLSFTAKLG